MKIQRFSGQDLEEALRLARMALGPEAVILQTRRVPAAGLMRLVGRPRVEVLAAVDVPGPHPEGTRRRSPPAHPETRAAFVAEEELEPPILARGGLTGRTVGPGAFAGGTTGRTRGEPSAEDRSPAGPRGLHPPPGPAWDPRAGWQEEIAALRREMATLRAQLQSARWGVPPAEEAPSATNPSAEGVAERLLSGIVTRTIEIREGTCTAVAVVGPTGVGKTTTIAKLAAVASRVERRRVALINVDTYRIGAVEQLETYAGLLEIPLSVAYSPEDVRAARQRYAGFDLVLVDTVGRSPSNTRQIAELSSMLEAASLDEVHLALDARGSYATQHSVLRGFATLRPTHLVLSKLDETPRLEDSLAAALEGGLPVSYLTTGQQVPEDLAPADRVQLAGWLLGGQ
jgi:flagellar biosynthesis protein FlhF